TLFPYTTLFRSEKNKLNTKNKTMCIRLILILCLCFSCGRVKSQDRVHLANEKVKIEWQKTGKGYEIHHLSFMSGNKWLEVPHPSGEYTLLSSMAKPSEKAEEKLLTSFGGDFPGKEYRYLLSKWDDRTRDVSLNTAGEAIHFFPEKATQLGDQKILFEKETASGKLKMVWTLDPNYPQDILISQSVEIMVPGYYSFSSPSLATVPVEELEWATVPGYFHGNYIGDDLTVAYAYGNGVPARPIIFSENTASTLSPIISSKQGFSLAVIPDPTLGRDPWEKDTHTHSNWFVGLSHMN